VNDFMAEIDLFLEQKNIKTLVSARCEMPTGDPAYEPKAAIVLSSQLYDAASSEEKATLVDEKQDVESIAGTLVQFGLFSLSNINPIELIVEYCRLPQFKR
jgi:hypothetical protein